MKFCPECGTNIEGMKFCPECGYKVNEDSAASPIESATVSHSNEQIIVEFNTFMFGLEGKKQNITKNIDLSIPQMHYTLTNQRLIIEKLGVASSNKQEINLIRINDVSYKQGLKGKVLGIGNVTIHSTDPSTPEIIIKQIKEPERIKESIRTAALKAKENSNVQYRQDV